MKRSSKEKEQQSAEETKKPKTGLRVALAIFVGAFLVTNIAYSMLHPKAPPQPGIIENDAGENTYVSQEHFNLLVMGIDEREDDIGRSDTMLFFSIPSDGSKPLLISIPRDTMIWKKEERVYERINAIYPVDGIEATVQMVQSLLGVPVNGYVKVNLEGFVKLVDIMGGVVLYIDETLSYEVPNREPIILFEAGEHKLSGKESLEYVRYRSDGTGDIGRVLRQQNFLKAVMEQALNMRNITKIPGMVLQGSNMIETDISANKIFDLVNRMARNGVTEFDSVMLPGDGFFYGRASMWMLRLDEMYLMLSKLLVPADQETKYLKLLEQDWISDYKVTYSKASAVATKIWEETGMWMSEADYAAWKASGGVVTTP